MPSIGGSSQRRSSVLSVLRRGKSGAQRNDSFSEPLGAGTLGDTEQNSPPCPGPGFFDLPAELRNTIYQFVICDAVLTIPTALPASSPWRPRKTSRKSKNTPVQLNGLLLASKQCRREYMTAMLSTIEVDVDIRDFDFEGLWRAILHLDELEAKALQNNHDLVISLNNHNCTVKALAGLGKWLDFRAENTVPLAWKYKVPLARLMPTTPMGRLRLLRELEYYTDCILSWATHVEGEAQQQELQAITAAFGDAIEQLNGQLGPLAGVISAARERRGMIFGGLR